jgi:glutathione S-transferase
MLASNEPNRSVWWPALRVSAVSIDKAEAILSHTPWLAALEYSLADVCSFSMLASKEHLHPEFIDKQYNK